MSNKIKLFQVDAFADKLFSGNPAAVCPLESWLADDVMQSIAAENNLAETAFVVPQGEQLEIRWFTPTVEVDLCGHATLAAAYVYFHCLGVDKPELAFNSSRSGPLKVLRQGDMLFLDFPTDEIALTADAALIGECIGVEPVETYKGRTDFLAVLRDEDAVRRVAPDLSRTARLPARGLIVTAKGDQVDFVSRFFAPQSGVDEDPVTGSAHTSLIPLWARKLRKTELKARQLSTRGGNLMCVDKGKRCLIGGHARLYMTGEIEPL